MCSSRYRMEFTMWLMRPGIIRRCDWCVQASSDDVIDASRQHQTMWLMHPGIIRRRDWCIQATSDDVIDASRHHQTMWLMCPGIIRRRDWCVQATSDDCDWCVQASSGRSIHSVATCIGCVTHDQKVPGSNPVWLLWCGHTPVLPNWLSKARWCAKLSMVACT